MIAEYCLDKCFDSNNKVDEAFAYDPSEFPSVHAFLYI
jgi:hypothetical protein